jgi:alpha-L-fucosidase
LPLGGTIQAACLTAQGRLGMVASKTFAGLSPIDWKVVAVDNQETGPAANAIDGNAATIWQTSTNTKAALRHFITIDMGTERRIAGFTYLPRQDGSLEGVVENYCFETSTDGNTWTTNVASGRFGNIRNSPMLQEMTFAPIAARFFRFTALQEINGNGWTSAAEISVLPAESGISRQ